MHVPAFTYFGAPLMSNTVTVIAEGEDERGRRYFRLGIDAKPILNLPPILASRLVKNKSDVLGELVNAGVPLFTSPSQQLLFQSVEDWGKKRPSFRVATRIGWNGGTYVLPDQSFGSTENISLSFDELEPEMVEKYRLAKGDNLDQWQGWIGNYCTGNTRLMFAVSLAFTGPILRLVQGPRSGGFQLYGDPNTGKSTAAMVAGSIWGCRRQPDKGFIESWLTTANAVEPTAVAHNDSILLLDETRNAGPSDSKRIEVVKDVVFRLAEQREKLRRESAIKPRTWRGYFLSTSNYSLDEMAEKGGAVVDDADRGRLVDVPLPKAAQGIYEDLHGFPSGEDFTDYLGGECREHYGAPIREFIAKLRRRKPEQLRKFLVDARNKYLLELDKRLKSVKPNPRISGRFATVYAAGSLAIRLGVLNWDRGELGRAILSCQLDGLRQPRGAAGKRAITSLRARLAKYLDKNKLNFFDLRTGFAPRNHIFGSVPGYIAVHKGIEWWYVTAEQLKEIIGVGEKASAFKESLARQGRLATSSGGKEGRRFVVERRIFEGKGKVGLKSVHALRRGALERQARH
jgi:putative DNA primase/helicase